MEQPNTHNRKHILLDVLITTNKSPHFENTHATRRCVSARARCHAKKKPTPFFQSESCRRSYRVVVPFLIIILIISCILFVFIIEPRILVRPGFYCCCCRFVIIYILYIFHAAFVAIVGRCNRVVCVLYAHRARRVEWNALLNSHMKRPLHTVHSVYSTRNTAHRNAYILPINCLFLCGNKCVNMRTADSDIGRATRLCGKRLIIGLQMVAC